MFKQLMDPIELLLVAAMGFSFMINEVIDQFYEDQLEGADEE